MLAMDVDGVLTDGRLWYGPDGEALKVFHVRDGQGIVSLRRAGLPMAILSARGGAAVAARADELGIEEVMLNLKDKGQALDALLDKYRLEAEQLCYIGDDLADLPVLRRVGLPLTVPGAPTEVCKAAFAVTEAPGGGGALREVCDLLMSSGNV